MEVIPKQLQNEKFRFYLVRKNSKIPQQKKWNTYNNYTYTDPILLHHVQNEKANYGIVTGYHNLIILDFDTKEYFESKKEYLPKTFVVRTALSKLPHYYYLLKGEKQISKIGIDDEKGKRVLDIQSNGAGIVAPNSRINSNYYDVINNIDISYITLIKLSKIFQLDTIREAQFKLNIDKTKVSVKDIKQSIEDLTTAGFKRTGPRHFKCPKHEMHGTGNLYVGDSGAIYCFHCRRYAKTAIEWVNKFYVKLRM